MEQHQQVPSPSLYEQVDRYQQCTNNWHVNGRSPSPPCTKDQQHRRYNIVSQVRYRHHHQNAVAGRTPYRQCQVGTRAGPAGAEVTQKICTCNAKERKRTCTFQNVRISNGNVSHRVNEQRRQVVVVKNNALQVPTAGMVTGIPSNRHQTIAVVVAGGGRTGTTTTLACNGTNRRTIIIEHRPQCMACNGIIGLAPSGSTAPAAGPAWHCRHR